MGCCASTDELDEYLLGKVNTRLPRVPMPPPTKVVPDKTKRPNRRPVKFINDDEGSPRQNMRRRRNEE